MNNITKLKLFNDSTYLIGKNYDQDILDINNELTRIDTSLSNKADKAYLTDIVKTEQFEYPDLLVAANATVTTMVPFTVPSGYRYESLQRAWANDKNAFVFNAYANSTNEVFMAVRNIGEQHSVQLFVTILFIKI